MTHHSWLPTGPAAVRGTVIVLPGRGEHGGVYERFGRRLAFDAYAVHALDLGSGAGDDASAAAEQVRALAADAVGPVVLAGSDVGALRALSLAVSGKVEVGGLILVGVPSAGVSGAAGDWEQELEVRTACPTHRARLDEDPDFVRGALSDPVPAELLAVLDDPALAGLAAPVLVLHGADDPVAPASAASALADRLPGAELALARTSAHDVLNDAIHRTIAAHVVQWLERVRADRATEPLLDVRPAHEPAAVR